MMKLDATATQLDAEEDAALKSSPLAAPAARKLMLARVRAIRVAWSRATAADKRVTVGQLAHAVQLAAGGPCGFEWRTADELGEVTGSW